MTALGRERIYEHFSRALGTPLALLRLNYANELRYGVALIQDVDWEKRIRAALPPQDRDLTFRVDMATQDPRPENPFAMGKKQIHIFDPSTGEIAKESLAEIFEFIPAKVVQLRVFSLDHEHDTLLAEIAENTLKGHSPEIKTSV